MGEFFVPPRVAYELQQETLRREAEGLRELQVEARFKWAREFEAELKRIDHRLFGPVFCPDPAPLDAVVMGAQPGRWHVGRENEGAPTSLLPILGPNGEYMEPTSRVFEQLKQMDWWDDRVMRDRRKRERELEEAKARREERERKEFDEECYERYMAVSRTQVSMNRDTPWTQNHAGGKRRG